MKVTEFLELAHDLEEAALGSIERVLKERGLPFDQASFKAQTSVDLAGLGAEALCYGAEVDLRDAPEG